MCRAEGSRTSRLKITSCKDVLAEIFGMEEHTVGLKYTGGKKDCMYFVCPLRIGQKSIEEFVLSITNNFLTTSAV